MPGGLWPESIASELEPLSPSRPSLSALHRAGPELQGAGAGREVHTTAAVPHPHKVDMWTPVIFTNDLCQ